jgi:hypothetical protein
MTSKRRTRLVVGVAMVALAAVPLGSWAARAHTQTYKANLSIHYDRKTQSLDGHVGTSNFCQEGRTITVSKTGGGIIGTAVSDFRGMWGPVAWDGPGSYYAQVSEVHEGGYGHDHTCLSDTSSTISAP